MAFFMFVLFLVFAVAGGVLTFWGKTKKNNFWESGFYPVVGLPLVALALVFFTLGLSITTVDAGEVGVVKRFGKWNMAWAPRLPKLKTTEIPSLHDSLDPWASDITESGIIARGYDVRALGIEKARWQ